MNIANSNLKSDYILQERNMLYKELEKGIKSLENLERYSEREVFEELDKI